MTDKQYKRVMRAFLGLLLAMVLLTLVIIWSLHQKSPQVNNYITSKGIKGETGQSIVGPQGLQGLSVAGPQGLPGASSVSNNTVSLQPIYTNVPVPGEKGAKGDPSPLQIITVDLETCQLKSKFEGDDLWQILAQLPKPCEVQ